MIFSFTQLAVRGLQRLHRSFSATMNCFKRRQLLGVVFELMLSTIGSVDKSSGTKLAGIWTSKREFEVRTMFDFKI